MFVNHGDNEAFQQGQDAKKSAEADEIDAESQVRLEKLRELTGIIHGMEGAADECESTAEHLLDLHAMEMAFADVPLFPLVQAREDGGWDVLTPVLPTGVVKLDIQRETYYRQLAARHTLNAAAYRRQARALRRLLDEAN